MHKLGRRGTFSSLLSVEPDPAPDATPARSEEPSNTLAEKHSTRTFRGHVYPLLAILIVALGVLSYVIYLQLRTSPVPASVSNRSEFQAPHAEQGGREKRASRPAARSSSRNRKSLRPRRIELANPPSQAASLAPDAFSLIEQLAFAQPYLPGPGDSSEHRPTSGPRFVAARPIHESLPDLPFRIRATVVSEVEIQAKVQVDESGRAANVDLVDSSGPASDPLLRATRQAAMLWRFAPAKLGNQPVASEVALVFRYIPKALGE
jgi:hypothetical protein